MLDVKRLSRQILGVLIVIGGTSVLAQSVAQQTFGIDFSPYVNGQDPNFSPQISVGQIQARLQIVAPQTKWIRTYSSTNGLENIPSIARQYGLKVAAGAWISTDSAQNQLEINNLIALANEGLVDVAVVGSEAILRNDVTLAELVAYMAQVRQAIPATVPVTTADVWGTFVANPSLIGASDVVFANFFPYWEGTAIDTAVCSLTQEYQQLAAAAGSKSVWISETGWPSDGNAEGAAVPSTANANLFALQFLTWANNNNIPSLYFESFDEAWKAIYEGPQGAHWGIYDTAGVIKPGMDAYFIGQTSPIDCNASIPGQTAIALLFVPPYGDIVDELEVQATGIQPENYAFATYIKVGGGWWTKPTFAQPTVAVNANGTARIPIVTGGSDQLATAIEVFLIPAGTTPPSASGGALPTISNAVASIQASRTDASISGSVTDSLNRPIAGAVISDPVLGTTTSAPDGKYSFFYVTTSGTATLTVTDSGFGFPTSPTVVPIINGNQVVNFVAAPASGPTQNTTTTLTSSLNPTTVGGNVTFTATVSGSAPTGSVGFTANGTTLSGCAAVALPTASANSKNVTCSSASLAAGTNSIVATYSGDSANSGSTSATLPQVVNNPGATSGITLSSSANPSLAGANVTFTATVTGNAPTGTVVITDSGISINCRGGSLPAGTGNSKTVTCTTSSLSVGIHSIVATYSGDGANSASASTPLSQVITNPGATSSTTLSSSANPSLVGASVTFTATVTGNAPTGAVVFTDGGNAISGCSAAALAAGAANSKLATCITSSLSLGTHSIVATYSGDGANNGSVSSALSQVINTGGSTASGTTLSSSANPSPVGASVTFTATATGNAPTGTVVFTDGGNAIGTCRGGSLPAGAGSSKIATCTTSSLSVGTHSIVATYSGDGANSGSASAPLSQVINNSSTTSGTTLSSSANPSLVGASVTFTATINGAAPTGAVAFTDGGNAISGCSAAALAAGAANSKLATCITSSLSLGTHSIVATYSGDSANSGSTSATLPQVVNNPGATSGITLSSSANPSLAGASVTFTATVTGNAPTGTVVITDSGISINCRGGSLPAGTGNSKTVTCTTSSLSVGIHSIVATYSGDGANSASASTPLSQVITNPGATSGITLSSSANPSLVGASVTFTATVNGAAPTGVVAFTDGGNAISGCSAVALPAGAANAKLATCTTSSLSLGTHSIVATYSGDGANSGSASAPLSQVVNNPGATSGITLSSSANPSLAGANVTFTATVTGNAPTGTVVITDSGISINCRGGSLPAGTGNSKTVTCTTSSLSVGIHSIVATYSGDGANSASASTPLSQVITNPGATSSTTLSSSANPSLVGASVTFTATVTGNAPTGAVVFTDGGNAISGCSAAALAAGAANSKLATCITSSLSLGTHSIVATYSGDGANSGSASAPLSQVVNNPGATSGITLSSSANPSLAGASVTFTATVTGNAPTGTVVITDSGISINCRGGSLPAGTGNSKTVTCTTSSLSVGIHSIVATYSGDGANSASASTPLSQVITNPGATSGITLSSSANPSLVGASVTFTATVNGAAPTGVVAFTDGGNAISGCSAVALPAGAANAKLATCTTSSLSLGTHSIVATYSGDGANNGSVSSALSQVVNVGSATPPGGCTLTPAATNVAAGTSITLTAFCATGTLPISFSLTGGAFQGLNSQQTSTSVGASFTASVTASTTVGGSASNGTSASLANATITVVTGGGGGGSFTNCTNQGLTVLNGGATTAAWGVRNSWIARSGFGDGVVWVIQITPPAGTAPSNSAGGFAAAEYGGPPTERQMTISTLPCDFRSLDPSGVNGPLTVSNGSSVSAFYFVGPATFGAAGMTAGTTYYVNFRNWQLNPTPGGSCDVGNCPAIVENNPALP